MQICVVYFVSGKWNANPPSLMWLRAISRHSEIDNCFHDETFMEVMFSLFVFHSIRNAKGFQLHLRDILSLPFKVQTRKNLLHHSSTIMALYTNPTSKSVSRSPCVFLYSLTFLFLSVCLALVN